MSCTSENLSCDSSCTLGFLSSGTWSSVFSSSEVWHSLATCILPSQIPRQKVSMCHSVTFLSKRWLSWVDLLHVPPNCSLLLGCCPGGRWREDAVYILLSPASFSTSSFRFLTSVACSFVSVLYVQVHSNLKAVMYILNRLCPVAWIQLYWNTFSCNRSPRPGYNRRALRAQLHPFAGFTYYCSFLPWNFQHYPATYLFPYLVLAKLSTSVLL